MQVGVRRKEKKRKRCANLLKLIEAVSICWGGERGWGCLRRFSSLPYSLVARQSSRIAPFIQSSLWGGVGFSGMRLLLITPAPISNPIHIPIIILNKLIDVIVTLLCCWFPVCVRDVLALSLQSKPYITKVQEEHRHPSSSILQCPCLVKQKIPNRKAMQLQPAEAV